MEFSKKGTRKDASEPWRERLSGGGGQRLESSLKIRFNVVTSLVGSIKGGFYPPTPAPPPGAPTLEAPVGAARLHRRLHVQAGHVCRVFLLVVLISVMSRSFTALLMVHNKDYSLDISV